MITTCLRQAGVWDGCFVEIPRDCAGDSCQFNSSIMFVR